MDLMTFIHTIWSAPLQIIIALVFLYDTMGPSIFTGFGVMLLMIPINAVIAAINRKLQVKQMLFKDSRIKLINEVLNGIKVRLNLVVDSLFCLRSVCCPSVHAVNNAEIV